MSSEQRDTTNDKWYLAELGDNLQFLDMEAQRNITQEEIDKLVRKCGKVWLMDMDTGEVVFDNTNDEAVTTSEAKPIEVTQEDVDKVLNYLFPDFGKRAMFATWALKFRTEMPDTASISN